MLIKSRHQSYWPLLLSMASSKSSVWDMRVAVTTLSWIWMFFQRAENSSRTVYKLISWLVFGVCWQWPPITYSREHLPPFATDGNPQGHRLDGGLHFAAGHTQRSRGNSGFLCGRGKTAPTREALCWHCVWTLWTMLSQTVRGYGPINHSVIGPAPVIIHPGPLILADVKWFLHEPSFSLSSGLCPWEFVMVVFSSKHLVLKLNWVFFSQSNVKAVHCRDGNVQNIYESKASLLARVKLEIFQAQPWM